MKILFVLLLALGCYANPTGSELKKPNSTAFDFTFQSPQNKIQETLEDMIKIEIGKETFLTRRNNNIFSCGSDSFGNSYCPSNLAKADSYWDYENGYSVAGVGQVVDYTNKICNGTMINGICYNHIIKDATKVTNLSCVSKRVPCAPNSASCCYIDISCSKNSATIKYHDCCNPQGGLKKTVSISDANQFLSGVYYQPYGNSQGKIICTSDGACSVYFQNAYCGGNAIGSPYLTNTFSLNTTDSYICNDNGYITGSELNADPKKCYNKKTLTCPVDYTGTTGSETSKGQCKRNIDYSYYEYKCGEEKNEQNNNYQVINAGGACSKLDSNNSTVNPELSTPCNNSTPPTNNCKRLGFTCNSNEMKPAFVDGEWKCSPFFCDGNLKCGYGTCDLPSKPSLDKYMDVAYNPLQYISNNQCNGDICDYTINAKVSYCESLQCPKGDDIIQDSGKCYKLECPKGTYLSGDKCIKVN